MSRRKTDKEEQTGIRDWALKRKALERIFGKWQNTLLAKAILAESEITDNVLKLAGSFKSWADDKDKPHNPTGWIGQLFVDSLSARLKEMGCTSTTIESVIVDGSYQDFYDMLPEEKRKAVAEPFGQAMGTHAIVSDDDAFHPVWVSREDQIDVAKGGLTRGRVDQKFYFLNPESSAHWKGVIDSGIYNQYKHCYAGLEEFIKKFVPWREGLKSGQIDGAVMLGGGGADKDVLLVNSMLNIAPPGRIVHYAMIDISFYMLMSSFRILDKTLIGSGLRKRVHLSPLVWDFLNLQGTKARLRRTGKNVVWFIPGGTIGNLDERQFFKSIAYKAQPGDFLVIGAEMVESDDTDAFKASLTEKYKDPSVRTFVVAPLRAAWHELKIDGRLEKALNDIKVLPVDGVANEHSVVPGTTTVELFIYVDGRKIVLLTSSRYKEHEFVEFARHHGFHHDDTVISPANPHYKHFVFRRVLP